MQMARKKTVISEEESSVCSQYFGMLSGISNDTQITSEHAKECLACSKLVACIALHAP